MSEVEYLFTCLRAICSSFFGTVCFYSLLASFTPELFLFLMDLEESLHTKKTTTFMLGDASSLFAYGDFFSLEEILGFHVDKFNNFFFMASRFCITFL